MWPGPNRLRLCPPNKKKNCGIYWDQRGIAFWTRFRSRCGVKVDETYKEICWNDGFLICRALAGHLLDWYSILSWVYVSELLCLNIYSYFSMLTRLEWSKHLFLFVMSLFNLGMPALNLVQLMVSKKCVNYHMELKAG